MADFLAAKKHILNELESNLPANLYYHSLAHTKDVFKVAEKFCTEFNLTEEEELILKTSALYHDSGFLKVYANHEEAGCEIVQDVLPKFGYSNEQISQIKTLIMATKVPQNPGNFLAELICDADLDYLGGSNYEEIAENLFREFSQYNIVSDEIQWFKMQVGFLNQHTFFNEYSKKERQPGKEKNLERVKYKLSELLNEE